MTKKLSELCDPSRSICYGIVQPGNPTDNGLPILRVKDLSGDRIDIKDVMRVAPEVEGKYRRSRIRTGDVLISLVGSMGQVAIAGPAVEGWNIARAVGLIPAIDRHHAEWIRISLQSQEAQDFIKDHANTTVQSTFNLKDLARLPIPYPPETTRDGILQVIGALDDKIEVNRKASVTLEEMAQALYRSWFVDFDPVWAKLEGRQPAHMDAATAALFPDSFDDDGLPVGWRSGKLSDVAVNPRNGVKPEQISPETPYIGLEHMPRRSITLPDWGTAADVGSQKCGMCAGDFLFGKLRPYFHKVGIAPVDGICSTDIIVVRPKTPEWAGFVLSTISTDEFVEHTNAGSSGTRMPRTNWSDMGGYEITLPSGITASAYDAATKPWRERIVAGVHENRTLATLRDTLLPRLMSGELRVGEARDLIEEVA